MDELKDQPCPICGKNTCTLMEREEDIPFFGLTAIFSMNCSDCGFRKADLEALEKKEPVKYVLEVNCEEDMNIRIIKSSECTVKIPHITTIESGPASNGYITNVEGLLLKVKGVIENMKESEDDSAVKKRCKNMLKKLQKVMWGQETIKITLEDPSGNSAIISEKVKKSKL